MDAEFILFLTIPKSRNIMRNGHFLGYSKWLEFWPKGKGGTLCKILKMGRFFFFLKEILAKILPNLVWMDAELF